MAVDQAILEAAAAGEAPPTLRLYDWQPPCLSIGYGQRSSDVDFERVGAAGWQVVRRPTGGRAILHADELTYSVALPGSHPIAAGSIADGYRRISGALVAALEGLGASPQAAPLPERQRAGGPVCFDASSDYEITVSGRKLVGSAQVRRKGGVLQHGSLPLRGDLGRICDVLAYASEDEREQARQHVRSQAVTLAEATGGKLFSWRTAAEAIAQSFAATFDLELVKSGLSPAEAERAHTLAVDVYGAANWTLRR